MLYNVTLGMPPISDWKLITDEKHNTMFVANDSIEQWIRIDSKFSQRFTELKKVVENSYKLPYGGVWVNNNVNMNPLIMMPKQERGITTLPEPEHVVFITIGDRYKILSFNPNHRILQTYHVAKTYQGCAIVVKESMRKQKPVLMDINVFDKKTNSYRTIKISLTETDPTINIGDIPNLNQLNDVRELNHKYKTTLGFKIIPNETELLTAVYFVTKEHVALIESITTSIKNRKIFVIPDNNINDEEYYRQIFEDHIQPNKIRAFTTVGLDVPLSICKEFRQLYVFRYNTEAGKLVCKKSK